MKTLSLALLLAAVCSPAWAQQPTLAPPKPSAPSASATTSLGSIAPTAEMWFYDQELRQRYSPELAVRRKAEFETQQRMQRIEAREWYGISMTRPTASITPFTTSSYSPSWTGNHRNRFRWVGHGSSTVVIPTTRPNYVVW